MSARLEILNDQLFQINSQILLQAFWCPRVIRCPRGSRFHPSTARAPDVRSRTPHGVSSTPCSRVSWNGLRGAGRCLATRRPRSGLRTRLFVRSKRSVKPGGRHHLAIDPSPRSPRPRRRLRLNPHPKPAWVRSARNSRPARTFPISSKASPCPVPRTRSRPPLL